ncbi:ornithine carbamoyltransferase [Virgibacillus halophilus]|uniref:ornithine carbamoyltransferase n=1 Tax=Tigheibacillus halophilus TaxID=361280 RepID=UPI00362F9013
MNTASVKEKPEKTLIGKDLLTLSAYSAGEVQYILDLAATLKEYHKKERPTELLKGKMLGMIFAKPSTRTRISFEAGMFQLGGSAMFLKEEDMQLSRGESIADTAKVLSGYLDGIMIRTFSQEMVEELAAHASIPVINGLTDLYHPCQALADLLTIEENKGSLVGLKITYIGDGNNVSHSLLIAAAMMGMDIAVATPPGCEPSHAVVQQAKKLAAASGGKVTVTNDAFSAVFKADAVYTDVWTSMGQEGKDKNELFSKFQVNQKMMHEAKPDAIFMHCLPAHRGQEVASEVMDSKQSAVFQQAENRLHAQKALLAILLGGHPEKLHA